VINRHTHILTFFPGSSLSQPWQKIIERKFSYLPFAKFDHVTEAEEAAHHLRKRGRQIVILGAFDNNDGYRELIPHLRQNHDIILVSGSLFKERQQTDFSRHGLHASIVDTVNFFDDIPPVFERVAHRNHTSGESKG